MPRTKKDQVKLTSKDYFDIDPVLNLSPDIALIFGMRGNGKTYQALLKCLQYYKKFKRTFVYIRRWKDDISIKDMERLFLKHPVEKIFGPNKYIKAAKGCFWLQDSEDEDFEPECIGYFVALNSSHHTKGQVFKNVKICFFDEFLQMSTERSLANEFDAWEQTLSTILRDTQDAQIIMCANTISKYSPYFLNYGVDVNSLKQGEIKEILLPNEVGEPTKVVALMTETSKKIAQVNSKYMRKSKLAQSEWEMPDVSNIPHVDNEVANEKLLCTMYDNVMNLTVGIFVRTSTWYTLESVHGIYTRIPHARQFLVIRQTDKKSSYYHLSTVKDLTYTTWCDINMMWKDILENTDIDIRQELDFGRVFAENVFIADNFIHVYRLYSSLGLKDLL